MLRSWVMRVGMVVAGFAVARPALPQSLPAEAPVPNARVDRPFLERVALGRARARLAARVWALPLADHQTVGTWAAQSATVERALRLWIRSQPKAGVARVFSDGTCDVDVHLMPEELAKKLIELAAAQRGNPVGTLSDEQTRQSAAGWNELWCCGSSALEDQNERSKKPPGWEDISADGVQMCRRAAQADAWAALLELAEKLKVTPARRLEEFLDSSPAVRQAVVEAIEKAVTSRIDFAADQVAIAEVQIGMPEFIRILTQAHQSAYQGDEFKAADFREMALSTNLGDLKAVGVATPPARYRLHARYEQIELDAPAWAATDLTATGAYVAEDSDEHVEPTQIELARLDGANVLRKQIEKLAVQPGITVAEFLSLHQRLKDDVVLWLAGAHQVGKPTRTPDGALRLRVELPAERLWQILRRGIRPVEVDPASVQPASQPTSQTAASDQG